MRRARLAPVLVLVPLLVAGCTWGEPPSPRVAAVSPATLVEGAETVLTVTGAGFDPEVTVDFDDPSRSPVCDRFRVELAGAMGVASLSEVVRVSSSELRGRLAPALARGTYDVRIVDARGGSAQLPAGFAIVKCLPPGSGCDDGNPCTTGEKCLGADRCENGAPVADGTPCDSPCPAGPVAGTCASGLCVLPPGACPSAPSSCGGS